MPSRQKRAALVGLALRAARTDPAHAPTARPPRGLPGWLRQLSGYTGAERSSPFPPARSDVRPQPRWARETELAPTPDLSGRPSQTCVRSARDTERGELVGTVIAGRYLVGSCLGAGGTSLVFDATRTCDATPVVVKVLRTVYAQSAQVARALLRESAVTRAVGHPGIVAVLDDGVLSDGSPYLVMERIRGRSLARMIAHAGYFDAPEAAATVMRVAEILEAVHLAGFVHRDVKPDHILISPGGRGRLNVHLVDFGASAPLNPVDAEHSDAYGYVVGTPQYMPPEQAAGAPEVDPRADVYSLGVVLYQLLSGRTPFASRNVLSLLVSVMSEEAPRLAIVAPRVSLALDRVVSRAIARDPEIRYPSAAAFARALAHHRGDVAAAEARVAQRLLAPDFEEPDGEALGEAV